MDSTYAEVGTEVILRQGVEFGPFMSEFLNKKAIITWVYPNRRFVRVDIDGGVYAWCVRAMILATDEPLLRVETRDLISALQEYRRYHAISVFADDLSPMARELTRPRWLGKRIDLEPSLHRLAKDFGLYLVNVRRDGFNSVIGLIELPDHKYVSISAAGSGETRDDIDDDIYRKLRKKMAELKKS